MTWNKPRIMVAKRGLTNRSLAKAAKPSVRFILRKAL